MPIKISEYTDQRLKELLPFPAVDANKYTRGKLVVVGGSSEYPGAACLCSYAAELTGAGYVETFCAPASVSILHAFRPSIVVRSWETLNVASSSLSQVNAKHSQAVLVGSGTSGTGEEADITLSVLGAAVPVLADGGALKVLATVEGRAACAVRAGQGGVLVLTPHFGEATTLAGGARLAVPAANAAEEDLAQFAQDLANAYNAYVMLKGPTTYIASPTSQIVGAAFSEASQESSSDTTVFAMRKGTSALAKAGTGDILAGTVGALLAQGMHPQDACVLGATLHAISAIVASEELTPISVCAEDVATHIPKAISTLVRA